MGYSNLTIKQEKFCNYYIETSNASEAYRRSYFTEKMSDKTIWEKASILLNNGKVRARIRELQEEQKKKSDIRKEDIIKELSNVIFSSIAHLHNNWIERKDFEKLTDEQKSSIKSISTKILKKNIGTTDNPEIVDVEYIKIELYDKISAITTLNKMMGWDAPVKTDNTTSVKVIIGD